MSNYWKKKLKELEAEEEKKKQSSSTSGSSSDYWQNKMDELEESNSKKEDIAPVESNKKRTLSDIATRYQKWRSGDTDGDSEDEKKWYQEIFKGSSAFDDGYDFGDGWKSAQATGKDLTHNIYKGLTGIVEGTIDAGATLIGGAGKLFGADDFGDKMADFVAKDIINEDKVADVLTTVNGGFLTDLWLGKDKDNYKDLSVSGDTLDSVAQSAGELAGTMLMPAGKARYILQGITAFGGEAEQAFMNDAGYGEAVISSTFSGVSAALLEGLSGAIKFGGSSADDFLAKQIATKITPKFLRTAAKFGLDVFGEGAEEWLEEDISNFGRWITYQDDKSFMEMFASEEAFDAKMEAFFTGGLMGGFSSGGKMVGNAINAKNTGVKTDFATGLTDTEYTVFKKIYDDRLAEAEESGKKLTNKEKSKIYDEVMEDIDNGRIDIDTIEAALGGDDYKAYQDTINNEEALQKEFDELGAMKKSDFTAKQDDRYNELKQLLADETRKTNRETLKTKLSDNVFNLAKSTRLAESYNEDARRGQAFQADLSQYDAKQQETIKKAVESGILNNSRRTHAFVDMVAKITADKGVLFDFTNNTKLKESGFAIDGKSVNGYVTKDGVTLNIDSHKSLNSVVGHEIAHVLEGTELYTELQKAVFDYAKSKNDYQGRYDTLTALYKNVKGANVDAELTADLVGDYLFTDSDFVKNLSANRNVFQKIYDEVKYLWKVATAGSKEARQLEQVKRAFDKAYKETGKEITETKYELSKDVNGNVFVDVKEDIFDGNNGETVARTIQRVIAERFNNLIDVHGQKIRINKTTNDEFRKSESAVALLENDTQAYNDKLKTIANADEILSVAKNWIGEEIKHIRKDDIVEFARGNVMYRVGENGYVADVIVGTRKNGSAVLYDLVNIYEKEIAENQVTMASDDSSQRRQGTSAEPIIPQNSKKSSGSAKFSLSDSDGRTLSEEQKAYFKGSKVVDENGNLKVVYHGSPSDFNTFSLDYLGTNGTAEGYGFYFTDSKRIAEGYSKGREGQQDDQHKGKLFEVYLDIKKPLSDTEVTMSRSQFKKFLIELNKQTNADGEPLDILSNYGDVAWEGLNKVLNYAMEIEYDASDSDTNMIHSIINGCGDMRTVFRVLREVTGYDGIIVDKATWGGDQSIYLAFHPEQIKNVNNLKPTSDPDTRRSLSENGAKPKQYGNYNVYGNEIGLKGVQNAPEAVQEDVAPVQEEVAKDATTTPTVSKMEQVEEMAPMPSEPTAYDLRQEQAELERKIQEAYKAEDVETFNALMAEYNDLTSRADEAEAAENAMQNERFESLSDADVPPEMEAPYYGESEDVAPEDPFENRDIKAVGNRKVKAYMYENPEVKPFFQAEANVMLGELQDTQKGERFYTSVEGGVPGEYGAESLGVWTGVSRNTTADIEYLLDTVKMSYSDIEKGLKAIIEDHGAENIAAAKKIEFILHDRLMNGHTDITGLDIPADQNYINLMTEKAIQEYTEEARQRVFADSDAPPVADIAPVPEVAEENTAPANEAPIKETYEAIRPKKETNQEPRMKRVKEGETYDTVKKGQIDGQRTMFEESAAETQKEKPIKTIKDRLTHKLHASYGELSHNKRLRREAIEDFNNKIDALQLEYDNKKNHETKVANDILRRIERLKRLRDDVDADYTKRINDNRANVEKYKAKVEEGYDETEGRAMRADVHAEKVDNIKAMFSENGLDLDETLKNGKNLSTLATVDNTPQRVMEKAFGYKAGQILSDATVNKVAQNETEGIRWLDSITSRKGSGGLLKHLSTKYHIKPGTKESAAAQMYAEGFYVNDKGDKITYGDAELAKDFPNVQTQNNIKGLANDPLIRQFYDDTLAKINESRTRNAYPEIKPLDNYFLHFRAMDDTFSRLGIPFNPNDIKAKDLPTDLNGVTADLKPGQPYFASAMHRRGQKTSHDLLGGMERYATGAKNQIYHIDDIQTLRALRNYIADTYGQANGLENLDTLSEEEAQDRIKQVFDSHLSTFAKFLNEEANVIAGKTALIDRGIEGIIGRRGITFLNTVNKQVGSNMVGGNISSAATNFLPVVQAFAKTNKTAFVKGFAQTVANKVGVAFGRTDSFADNPTRVRRQGADRFYRTPWQKVGDAGYVLMSAADNISTEIVVRAKYNELIQKGMSEQQAITEADKWASRLMGDRSLGQMPQLYNSQMLGLVTKFQLEVRNQLDSQFYDTIQEAKASNEDIENGLSKNAKTAAKVAAVFAQLAIAQHLFGKTFESIAGYNPAFDIIDVMIKALGFDDEEDSEDTALDNLEQGFLALLEDLPYSSVITDGGRIPISSALPIGELITGEDQYGNEKSRAETLGEIAPYYLMPTGYGQAKKTIQGLSMFSEDHPIAGSYTDSGNLRFPVDDTFGNRVQAGLFGQWANENARDYFDNERKPLEERQIEEFKDVGMTIQDYWKYREGLSKYNTLAEKADYINSLDLTDRQKNILINNIADRKEDLDMSSYDDYSSFEEFDFASKNPEKYTYFTDVMGLSYDDYASADEDTKRAYSWAYENPEKYTLSKAVSSDFLEYYGYKSTLSDFEADKDEDGKSISGSKKEKVIDYINNNLDNLDYGQKIILYRSMYNSQEDRDNYNRDIVDYLNSREDISYEDMATILKELGFTVTADGNIYWD